MIEVAVSRSGWFGIISSAATAVVVGFASTILLIMQAAQAGAVGGGFGHGRNLGPARARVKGATQGRPVPMRGQLLASV